MAARGFAAHISSICQMAKAKKACGVIWKTFTFQIRPSTTANSLEVCILFCIFDAPILNQEKGRLGPRLSCFVQHQEMDVFLMPLGWFCIFIDPIPTVTCNHEQKQIIQTVHT